MVEAVLFKFFFLALALTVLAALLEGLLVLLSGQMAVLDKVLLALPLLIYIDNDLPR